MTTPVTDAERRGLQVLGLALQELRAALPGLNEVDSWRRTLEVLNLMHSLDDQAHRRLKAPYREVTRRATGDGRTQAALTLVRGIAHHHGSEVQAGVWQSMGVFAAVDGAWVPMRISLAGPEGQDVPMQVATAVMVWRPLSDLPRSTEPMHDRDTYYAQHVQGRPLLEPLLAAERFLVGLQIN